MRPCQRGHKPGIWFSREKRGGGCQIFIGVNKSLVVNKVIKEDVALDSVELLFKEQYLGRSEMWRLKKTLVDSVVFLKKKIGFSKDSVRCDVSEMWGRGDRVACGIITPDTKVVFRSTTI